MDPTTGGEIGCADDELLTAHCIASLHVAVKGFTEIDRNFPRGSQRSRSSTVTGARSSGHEFPSQRDDGSNAIDLLKV